MNRRATRFLLGGLAACLGLALTAGLVAADPPSALEERQDVLFLTEARPVLLRLRLQLDGKSIEAAWGEFVHVLVAAADRDGDGELNADEAHCLPPVDQIISGGIGRAFGGLGGRGGSFTPLPTLKALDTDNDGRVSFTEVASYYRANGLAPVQLQPADSGANPFGAGAILGGRRPEPKVEAVAEAIFAALDTNHDGKLTRDELAAAPRVLLRRDADDDEMLTAAEVAPDAKATTNMVAGMMAMGMRNATGPAPGPKRLLLLPSPGTVPEILAGRCRDLYTPTADKSLEPKLARQPLGLDKATFARLDTNHDGVLDAKELAGLAKQPPDFEFSVRLGRRDFGAASVSVLGGVARAADNVARLDLGRTRADLRTNNTNAPDQLSGILRQQFLAQFKQADKANLGYLDEKSAQARRVFSSLFHALDRDGDGKVYEAEIIAYLDQLADFQARARSACVTLGLKDQSRGLFDLLDTNRDGRLGMRELRGAVKLLETLDRSRKGYLERADLPASYQLTLRRGPITSSGGVGLADLYRLPENSDIAIEPTAGPRWFRKMDRNRDGDVSRREFLGSDEQFRQIDTDHDGLISADEAERFDLNQRRHP